MLSTGMKRDYSYFNDYKDGPRSNIASFKKWLRLEFEKLVDEPNKVLIIVSHGKYIRHLIYNLGYKNIVHETKNCEANKFFYDIENKELSYLGEYKYTKLNTLVIKDNCKTDFCRYPSCGKKKVNLSCDDVSTLFQKSRKNTRINFNKTRKNRVRE